MAEVKKPYEPKRLTEKQRELLWLRYQGSDDVLGMLIGHIDVIETERKKTLEHLQNYRKAKHPSSDTIMVMVLTEANNATSSALWCADLHDLDFALESVFTGGDPDGLFEDFWADGDGIDIRFKRVSREEFDKAMDEDNEWDGF